MSSNDEAKNKFFRIVRPLLSLKSKSSMSVCRWFLFTQCPALSCDSKEKRTFTHVSLLSDKRSSGLFYILIRRSVPIVPKKI